MHTESARAQWLKPTSQETGVIIISNADLPEYIIDTINTEISDWEQVAHLVIKQSTQLEEEWLDAESRALSASKPSSSEANGLLSSIPKTCHLLDVEASQRAHLSWLGSVCGHKLHFFGLQQTTEPEPSKASMDLQVEEILAATQHLVKSYLQDHFMSPS
ncbi:transketolase [Pseudomonas sp. NPDC089734]|uniref:transketolase n=1 Tax=Pseudomonas sp. NPDC089734 TaxID=3364469 RepID=UPI0037FC8F5A